MNSDSVVSPAPSIDAPEPADIRAAYERIAPYVRRTPLLEVAAPASGGEPVSLKLECLQHTGSFKARGAFHNLLTRAAPPVGCATASGGNHGAAVAYAAKRLGVPARIFVPTISTPAKVARIKAAGADVVIGGAAYADAQAACDAYVAESGALLIHPYAARETVAGAGTVALEWEEDLKALGSPSLDTVLIAVGGGGLVSGIAAWFSGRVKVVGVEPEGSRAMQAAFQAGGPIDVEVRSVAADSLGARRVGAINFEICRRWANEVVLVPDDAIVEAQRRLWRESSIVAEPGGATAYAALGSGAYRPATGERVGVLVCGSNVDLATFAELF